MSESISGQCGGRLRQYLKLARRGLIIVTETVGASTRIEGEIPLAEAFGYMTTLRSMTQGQGTFSMEFAKYKKVPMSIQEAIIKERKGQR